jgi:hypothetical protein
MRVHILAGEATRAAPVPKDRHRNHEQGLHRGQQDGVLPVACEQPDVSALPMCLGTTSMQMLAYAKKKTCRHMQPDTEMRSGAF